MRDEIGANRETPHALKERSPVQRAWPLIGGFVAASLLGGCADERVATYQQDHRAFLKELIYCENNYAAERETPGCRAAFKVNADLFPE